MNVFLEQFLLEAREQIEQITADLLSLEKSPEDSNRLDGILRAFHTLKGGAGIVDFTALASSVHLVEGLLARARADRYAITPGLIEKCLACVDQIVHWLDIVERTGALPAGAGAQANALAATLRDSTRDPAIPSASHLLTASAWIEALRAKHEDVAELARSAIRYAPDPDCFFAGADPIARIADLPGLLALDVSPALPWPPLDSLDPFVCNVVISALTRLSATDAATALDDIGGQCDIRSLHDAQGVSAEHPLSRQAREVLQAQLALIGNTGSRGVSGRWASAGVTAINVARHAGRHDHADRIASKLEASLTQNSAEPVRDAIQFLLDEPLQGSEHAAVPSPPRDGATPTLRIDAARVDALVSLTGELTVAKNAFGHAVKLAQESGNALAGMLRERHVVLERLVGELQQSVLGMRVRPLHTVFQRFPRLIRELSAELGKPASLLIEGGDTEADKAIVEMLSEPLLHVLRNALGHGVEDAGTRATRGKPFAATIRLRALRQGEDIVVEISDDGGGVDVQRVRDVALERKLVAAESIAVMSEADLLKLLFAPGFTTSRAVTSLSGRGIGLDSVRTAVERIGGRVDIESTLGQGTKVRITVPFSVMLTRVMIVGAGEQRFAIPLDSVVETLRVTADRIVAVGSAHAIVIRDRVIPLIRLGTELNLPQTSHQSDAMIVVTTVNGALGALQVDHIGERMDVMLKPLEGLLANSRGISGSTLLGDGSVLLLLDLEELFK